MGDHPLFAACSAGDDAAVAAALSSLAQGVPTTSLRNGQGWTPVHVAARFGHVSVLQTLLCHDDVNGHASASAADTRGNTAAWVAAYGGVGDSAVYKTLAAHGADLTAPNKEKQTPVFAAAAQGHAEAVGALLAAAPSDAVRERMLTVTDGWRSPLQAAVSARRSSAAATVKTLLGCGANPGATDGFGATPLVSAAAAGRADVVAVLLRHGSSAGSPPDSWPCQPLRRPTSGALAFHTPFDAARALEAEGKADGADVIAVLREHGLRTPPPLSADEVAAAKAQGQQCPVQ